MSAEEMNANQRKLIIELRNELVAKDKEIDLLSGDECKCEACQRWTLAEDMRTSEECGGSCCVWCLILDDKDKLIESLSSSDPAARLLKDIKERDSLIHHYKRRIEELEAELAAFDKALNDT